MKRILIIFVCVYVLTLSLLQLAASAATSGAINLTGTVPPVTSITIVPVVTPLDLTVTGVNVSVATVTEASNVPLGYTVTLSSANAGIMKNGVIGSVPYTLKYNGVATTLSVSPGVTVTTQGSSTSPISTNKSVTVSYTGVAAATTMSGTYSDTLTLTITGN